MKKPTILVTNDDSIHATGIQVLISIARKLGNVIVMAPEYPMSGKSHSITSNTPLRSTLRKQEEGYVEYTCAGTPVDCVKLAQHLFFKEKGPDLVVSGINHGSNASINIIYSGTMGAALESCLCGHPAIGFSLVDYAADADFSYAEPYVCKIMEDVLQNALPQGICLNVNIPCGEIKGIKVCKQAKAFWHDAYDQRVDPHGCDYFWLTGNFVPENAENGDDISALEQGYVSVVPVQHDLTAYSYLSTFEKRMQDVEKR